MKTEEKRLALLMGGGLVLALLGAAIVLLLLRGGGDEANPSDAKFEVTAAQAKEASEITTTFIEQAGHFGVTEDEINKDNVFNYYWSESTSPDYLQTKGSVYDQVRTDFLSPASRLINDNLSLNDSAELLQRLTSVRAESITAKPSEEGFELNGQKFLNVEVSFVSTFTSRTPSAQDATWDGTFIVSRVTAQQTGTVVLTQTGAGWRVYDLKDLTYPSAMPFSTTVWDDTLPQGVDVETFKAPVPTPPETPDTQS